MSEGLPPPLPPGHVNMTPRWVTWVVASVLGPLLPVIPMMMNVSDTDPIFALLALALVLQFAASVFIAVGASRKRTLGPGGVVGLSLVFMIGSVAIGTAAFFAGCLAVAASM